jgi:catechol 2,3-dioxygenase-like lactoylglutathione lyase family enzyme
MRMLSDARVGAAVPCQDIDRAKSWYKENLGLSPSEENPGGAYFKLAGGTEFFLFPSSGKSDGSFTQVGFEVPDLEAEVAELKKSGVTLEEYDFPGLKTVDGIADIEGEKGCWFKDSEGNLLAVFERTDR